MADLMLTDQNFKQHVLDNSLPVVVDFWAPSCGPSKIIEPAINEHANCRYVLKWSAAQGISRRTRKTNL